MTIKVDQANELAQLIEEDIKAFARTSPLNRMPGSESDVIFDEPIVQFADGDDPLFIQYKTVIDPSHLTPREALAKTFDKSPEDLPARISVISWILPVSEKTRKSNRTEKLAPSRLWSYTRWYGEKFNNAVREHAVKLLKEKGYLAAAPVIEPYFRYMEYSPEKGYFSNWSERHMAYAAGLGTFSLSDGFITERGITHRCGSVVAGAALPPGPRTAKDIYSNCLHYVNVKCRACIERCPAGAISDKGHDKLKCGDYLNKKINYLQESYQVAKAGCGLCQTGVPCEFRNPTQKPGKKDKTKNKRDPWWFWFF